MAKLERGKPVSLQEQAHAGRAGARAAGRRRLNEGLCDRYVKAYAILGAVKFNKRQLYRHLTRIFCGWAFFAAIVAAFAISGIRMDKITRDPAELADLLIYYGLLSNIGMLVWGAGAFISFFASFHVEGPKISGLLRWAGILTLILLLDDFLLIHDEVFPNLLLLPEWLVYLFYLVTFPLFFFSHLNVILKQTEYRILALGIFLMGVSVLIDMHVLPGGIDVEDSFKLAGIVAYSYYWIFTSHQLIA